MILVQLDFPYAGPWGVEMTAVMAGLTAGIRAEPGLRWMIWTEAPHRDLAGAVALFDSRTEAEAFVDKHAGRLEAHGFEGIRAVIFNVNAELSDMTLAPLPGTEGRALPANEKRRDPVAAAKRDAG